jgi:hypothetical protein
MADDLVTTAEVKVYLGISVSTYDALIAALIGYVTGAIETYCGRTWTLGEVIDYLDGGREYLIAKTIPISDVFEILDLFSEGEDLVGDELVANGGFASDSDWTKGAGWSIAGGVAVATTSTASLTQSGILTLGSIFKVVYTISGYSGGTITAKLGTTALTTRQADGEFTETGRCLGNKDFSFDALTSLTANVDLVSVKKLDFTFEPATGLIYPTWDATTLQTPLLDRMCWSPGKRRFKVTYNGGTNTAPADVKLAAIQSVADLYLHRDQSLQAEKIGDYSYTRGKSVSAADEALTPAAISLLSKYRVIAI